MTVQTLRPPQPPRLRHQAQLRAAAATVAAAAPRLSALARSQPGSAPRAWFRVRQILRGARPGRGRPRPGRWGWGRELFSPSLSPAGSRRYPRRPADSHSTPGLGRGGGVGRGALPRRRRRRRRRGGGAGRDWGRAWPGLSSSRRRVRRRGSAGARPAPRSANPAPPLPRPAPRPSPPAPGRRLLLLLLLLFLLLRLLPPPARRPRLSLPAPGPAARRPRGRLEAARRRRLGARCCPVLACRPRSGVRTRPRPGLRRASPRVEEEEMPSGGLPPLACAAHGAPARPQPTPEACLSPC
ncbi:hypothetical protein GHT09_009695 [Marmota monax]|uniref:Uncharacterized protein n=1 Tax=Marmota monax TaxID=9995 RepID=A0A834UL97_MARMO|nr:hypothetical protein GHT09_009695 [Marmota monax]